MRSKKVVIIGALVVLLASFGFIKKILPSVNLTVLTTFQEEYKVAAKQPLNNNRTTIYKNNNNTRNQTYNRTAVTAKQQQQPPPNPNLKANDDDASKNNNNNTHIVRGKAWFCGWTYIHLTKHLFPDYEFMGKLDITKTAATNQSSVNDVVLFGMNGPCPGLPQRDIPALLRHFQGKVLLVNGEPHGSIDPKDDDDDDVNGGRVFQMGGPVLPQHTSGSPSDIEYYKKHIIRGVYFGIYDSWNRFPDKLHHIFEPSQRKQWKFHNNETSKIIYAQSNCVQHRQRVARELAKHFQVEAGGGCQVPGAKRAQFPARLDYGNNWESAYSKYKYCITMENTAIEGYMSEKIFFGFMGGCLPIYYGTRESFQVLFNPNAFLFVEAEKAGGIDALVKTIQYLEQNQTAYEERMAAPILKNGTETINLVWSLSDSIGDGSLKKKIRTRMGL